MATTKIKNIAIVLATVIGLGITGSSFASGSAGPDRSGVKFIGTSENSPVFQLELKNDDNTKYFVTIRNSEKKILLYERLSGTNILRRYRLHTEDISLTEGTTIEVTNKKTKETWIYTIKGNSIMEENLSDFKNLMRSLATD